MLGGDLFACLGEFGIMKVSRVNTFPKKNLPESIREVDCHFNTILIPDGLSLRQYIGNTLDHRKFEWPPQDVDIAFEAIGKFLYSHL